MKYYNIPDVIGSNRSAGAAIGFGPKASKVLIVRGLDKTPMPKYMLPPTTSPIRKTFGTARYKCVGVIRGNK